MCENKTNCSCGCSVKKEIKEGTWAPTVWNKNTAMEAKTILQGLINDSRKDQEVNLINLLDKFSKKYWNKIGDDEFYDYIDNAKFEFEKKRPAAIWRRQLLLAINRIDQLEKIYLNKNRIEEAAAKKKELLEKINLKLTSNTKIELVKQAKIALDAMYTIYSQCEKRDVEHDGFLDIVDSTFEKISELLAVLIGQESIEMKK